MLNTYKHLPFVTHAERCLPRYRWIQVSVTALGGSESTVSKSKQCYLGAWYSAKGEWSRSLGFTEIILFVSEKSIHVLLEYLKLINYKWQAAQRLHGSHCYLSIDCQGWGCSRYWGKQDGQVLESQTLATTPKHQAIQARHMPGSQQLSWLAAGLPAQWLGPLPWAFSPFQGQGPWGLRGHPFWLSIC